MSTPSFEHEPTRAPRAREVTISELDRYASRVVRGVIAGEIAVVSRHGRPVALVLPLDRAILELRYETTMTGPMRELLAAFERRDFQRAMSALMHGRWWTPPDAG